MYGDPARTLLLLATPPASRADRLSQYRAILGDGSCERRYAFTEPCTQVHYDARRSLWTFFQTPLAYIFGDLTAPELRDAYQELLSIGSPNSRTFVAMHQSLFERFVMDTLAQYPEFPAYFQGFTDVLEPLYYTALCEEYLVPTSSTSQKLLEVFITDVATASQDAEDFVLKPTPPCNMDTLFTIPYSQLLSMAYSLCQNYLFMYLDANRYSLVRVAQLSFEPLLRLIDSELYGVLGTNESLGPECQLILLGSVITGGLHNVPSIYGKLRLLDGLIAGGTIFSIVVSMALQSLAMHLHIPGAFATKSKPNDYTCYHGLFFCRPALQDFDHAPPRPTIDDINKITVVDVAETDVSGGPQLLQALPAACETVEAAIPRLVDYALNFSLVFVLLSRHTIGNEHDAQELADSVSRVSGKLLSGTTFVRKVIAKGLLSDGGNGPLTPGRALDALATWTLSDVPFELTPYLSLLYESMESDKKNHWHKTLTDRGIFVNNKKLAQTLSKSQIQVFLQKNAVPIALGTLSAVAIVAGVVAGAVAGARSRPSPGRNK